jgi:alpha-methylacyl-CoA racemase
LGEAAAHPHNIARGNFYEADGYVQPAPAPKFSHSPPEPGPISTEGADSEAILKQIGYSDKEISTLKDHDAV